MRWSELVDQVREYGRYPSDTESERVVRTVLAALGGHLPAPLRDDLAARLPAPAAAALRSRRTSAAPPPAAPDFVEGVAKQLTGATPATARWDVSSVLCVLPDVAGDELVDRTLAALPSGYALLFGRAELVAAA